MNIIGNTAEMMNSLGERRIPFLFILDFEMKKPIVLPLAEVSSEEILFDFNTVSNAPQKEVPATINFRKQPPSFVNYQKAFDKVMYHLRRGDSYLLNLTMPTEIETDCPLRDMFFMTKAKYKLWLKDSFLCFSPEIFVRTEGSRIFTHPMKGTIDAAVPEAERILMDNRKEQAEHATIVDLLRNDLNMIAKKVRVDSFRYIDRIPTNEKEILQVSSMISGELPDDFHCMIGDMLMTMLPAGSVSGAPKKKTVEIIRETEQEDRGYYTGICGIFDGENLDSGVMIRFIEVQGESLRFRSGGGITVNSNVESEYQELIDKVYVPLV